MKSKFFLLFERLNPIMVMPALFLFSLINKLRRKPKVLIYTDSRGFEVTKPWNRKNPFSSYIKNFIFNYDCTVRLCPEKFTSLVDFINFYESTDKDFDFIILHCGIVDFAPRPESSFKQMYNSKLHYANDYHIFDKINSNERVPSDLYEGEDTYSFLTEDVLLDFLLPKMQKIPNLIYIGINPVLMDWKGNYWRQRPININKQLDLDKVILDALKGGIPLSDLSREQIKTFTTDNVHYTSDGFKYIYNKIISKLHSIKKTTF
jgi:hypothetical protein